MTKYFSIRYIRGMYHKIMRNTGSPEYNARGVALGLFIGFFVPMGFQLMIAVPLSFVFKCSKILASIFTFVSNHITICVIYPVQCLVGSYIMFNPLSYSQLNRDIQILISSGSMGEALKAIGKLGLELGLYFFVGGLLFGAISSIIGYFIALKMFRSYQKIQATRKKKKEKKREKKKGLKL